MPTGIYERKKPAWNKGKHPSPATEFKKGHKLQDGKNNSNWKGGEYKSPEGYILILKHGHPKANHQGYVKRSHLIMEKHLGRYLIPEEIVHHKGIKYPKNSVENRQDDRIENLRLFKNTSTHSKFHYPKGSMFGANSKI